jgi:holo-[acyl-carrier protein] synthase
MVLGVDLIEIARVERALARFGDRFLERVFTPAEIVHSRGRLPELAARFAAKEAVSKALGVGVRMLSPMGIDWRDVEVTADRQGKPLLQLYGRAAERSQELGLAEWEVSLSHSRELAIALVGAQ